jgi:thiol-disulfide isomerase/thioredoxin
MRTRCLAGLAVGCVLHLCAGLAVAQTTQPRPVDQVLADLEKAKVSPLSPEHRNDKAMRDKYRAEVEKAQARQAELAWELYLSDPTHAEVEKHLQTRWRYLSQDDLDAVLKETAQVMAEQKGRPLAGTAAYIHADAVGEKHGKTSREYVKAIETYRAVEPDKPRGATLYMTLAASEKDPEKAKQHYRAVTEYYPSSRSARMAEGKIRQLEGVGQPFELRFRDATTDREINMRDLRGKVVVVDFWATWCGPCIAEMPHMKELYAKYKDKGVEFIGVSLDNPEEMGGLDKLRQYVKDNNIGWPQYYQGKGWDSEFSTSWGINAIPCLFIVDKQGNLHSTRARGKLDELIPELLAK